MSVAAEIGLGERIIALIASMPGCQIEDLVKAAPDLSWNQIFGEIDQLSRTGRILVTLRGRGDYMLSLSPYGRPEPYPRCAIEPAAATGNVSTERSSEGKGAGDRQAG